VYVSAGWVLIQVDHVDVEALLDQLDSLRLHPSGLVGVQRRSVAEARQNRSKVVLKSVGVQTLEQIAAGEEDLSLNMAWHAVPWRPRNPWLLCKDGVYKRVYSLRLDADGLRPPLEANNSGNRTRIRAEGLGRWCGGPSNVLLLLRLLLLLLLLRVWLMLLWMLSLLLLLLLIQTQLVAKHAATLPKCVHCRSGMTATLPLTSTQLQVLRLTRAPHCMLPAASAMCSFQVSGAHHK
jgi:hypothetical protein